MPMSPRLLRPIANNLDPDAAVYLNAVAQADQQQLEPAVRKAINDFVVGCKRDGIWSSIKASCLLMGARTLSGALTPLVGAAPTNNGPFVSGDYDRKTGLVGNGTSKYLDTNYAWGSTTLNDRHMSAYASSIQTSANNIIMGSVRTTTPSNVPRHQFFYVTTSTNKLGSRMADETSNTSSGNLWASGFIGSSRSGSSSYVVRGSNTNETITQASVAGTEENLWVFARNLTGSALHTSSRIAFYSAGNSLALATLDSRVTTLYNAIGAAI